jgi:hypothetical protein
MLSALTIDSLTNMGFGLYFVNQFPAKDGGGVRRLRFGLKESKVYVSRQDSKNYP